MTGLRSSLAGLSGPPLSRESPVRSRSFTEFEVDDWAISAFVVRKLVPVVGTHPFPLHELMLMVAALCWVEPPQIFD
jgi:hypothetical protein